MKAWQVILIASISILIGYFIGNYFAQQTITDEMKNLTTSIDTLNRSVNSLEDKFYQSEVEFDFKNNDK